MGEIDTSQDEATRFTAPLKRGEESPAHDAWMKAEIRKTLAKKQAGKMTYRSLDEVMRKFGFDAR